MTMAIEGFKQKIKKQVVKKVINENLADSDSNSEYKDKAIHEAE